MGRRIFHSMGFGESAEADFVEPDRLRFFDGLTAGESLVAQGAGVSLAGAGFGPGVRVIGMRHFDRILAFDADRGRITVEAGATLAKLFGFLAPKRWMLAAIPGYAAVTVGGCVAGNVHGKNQYADGCFGDWVEEMELFHPAHGRLKLSPSQNAEPFDLTIGGFGLTGIILTVTLRLQRLAYHGVRVVPTAIGSLAEAIQVLRDQSDAAEFLYSWHDLAGGNTGSGLVFAGHPDPSCPQGKMATDFHRLDPERFTPPVNLMNRWSLTAMNALYRRLRGRPVRQSLWNALFPFSVNPAYFYLYGRTGFLEHQVLVPWAAAEHYLDAFLKLRSRFGIPCGLVSMKVFRGTPSLLRFTGAGISLAVEIAGGPGGRTFLTALDALDLEFGCRANIMKDSRLPAEAVARQYPELERFQAGLRHFDPDRLFRSSLSMRLGL